MQNKYIKKLLKIQGVTVKKIENDKNNINIFIETKPKPHICPSCKHYTKNIHDYRTQKIQHLSVANTASFLILNKRRYICNHCGKKFYENYAFTQKFFRKSIPLFDKIIEDLKQLKNFKTIAKDNHTSAPTVTRFLFYYSFLNNKMSSNIFLPKHIGIDEFKGNCGGNKYLFHIYDLDTHATIDIVHSKSYNELEKYFSKISNRHNVEIVSMDLCKSFKRIIMDKFPKANIIADCFHFTRTVMNSLDKLRLNIWRKTKGKEKKYFKHIKHSLMKSTIKVNDKDNEKLLYAFEYSPILKFAYNLKNQFLDIKRANTFEEKEKLFREWLFNAECSTIQEFKPCIKTLREWHKYISNYFKTNFSNGPVEGKNNLIKVIKRISFGFRNFDNFRNRILILEL